MISTQTLVFALVLAVFVDTWIIFGLCNHNAIFGRDPFFEVVMGGLATAIALTPCALWDGWSSLTTAQLACALLVLLAGAGVVATRWLPCTAETRHQRRRIGR